jgi:hypothetical protein
MINETFKTAVGKQLANLVDVDYTDVIDAAKAAGNIVKKNKKPLTLNRAKNRINSFLSSKFNKVAIDAAKVKRASRASRRYNNKINFYNVVSRKAKIPEQVKNFDMKYDRDMAIGKIEKLKKLDPKNKTDRQAFRDLVDKDIGSLRDGLRGTMDDIQFNKHINAAKKYKNNRGIKELRDTAVFTGGAAGAGLASNAAMNSLTVRFGGKDPKVACSKVYKDGSKSHSKCVDKLNKRYGIDPNSIANRARSLKDKIGDKINEKLYKPSLD